MARNCRFAVAVHIATVLATHSDGPATSDWLAGSVNTNPVVVRRILAAMSRAGLVKSQRGVAGGSLLARRPSDITLLDLYRAVDEEEPPAIHNQPPNPACPVGARIVPVLIDILGRAEAAKEGELSRITVADVAAAVGARPAAE